jgi:FPC/CPF motif-containing protein YcgG
MVVFNPHFQFERLRREGSFEKWKDIIRRKDEAVSGPNPFLVDHGTAPGWAQYTNVTRLRCPLATSRSQRDPTLSHHSAAFHHSVASLDHLPLAKHIEGQFRAMITASSFPCIGAKATAHSDTLEFHVYKELGEPASTAAAARDLHALVSRLRVEGA